MQKESTAKRANRLFFHFLRIMRKRGGKMSRWKKGANVQSSSKKKEKKKKTKKKTTL